MTAARLAFLASILLGFAAALTADTGTPYPAGRQVEVTTQAGTVSGTLQDRTTPGWILLKEAGRQVPTAVPEKAIAFVRAGAPPLDLPLTRPSVPAPEATAPRAAPAHFIHGQPRVARPDRFAFEPAPGGPTVAGLTVLRRFAFTVGHYDRHKVPAWVAMRWDKRHLDISRSEPKHPRPFEEDPDLPDYARTGRDYDHKNTGYQRGHMARHEDLSGFHDRGDPERGTREGCLMSNIVPQLQKGHAVWGRLEEEHRHVVADPDAGIGVVWLIAGPVFTGGQAERVIGPARVGAPRAVYKIIAWQTPNGQFTARGYVIQQRDSNSNLATYLTKIDDIEEATGLDFFPDLDDRVEAALESRKFDSLWGDQ